MTQSTSAVGGQGKGTSTALWCADLEPIFPGSVSEPELAACRRLTRTYRLTHIILVVQALLLLSWSSFQWQHFALTYDFATYFHAWHGYWANGLNPLDTSVDHLVLANNAVLITWPLAVITRIYPHGVVLLWIQDLFVVAAEFVIVDWMFDAVGRSRLAVEKPSLATTVFGTGFLLIVLNPWIYWSTTFDFHVESVAILFLVLAARALANRRWRQMAFWVVGIVLCGYVTATYVIGLGLAALIVGGGRRRMGLVLLLGPALLVPAIVFDPTLNQEVSGQLNVLYGYLSGRPAGVTSVVGLFVGLLVHFPRMIQTVWDRAINLWANVAPSGLLGLASPWVLGIALIVLPENLLNSNPTLVAPSFQYLPLYLLLPLGTVFVLLAVASRGTRWIRHRPTIVTLLTGIVLLNACGWGVVWLPRLSSSWVRVRPQAAAFLGRVERQIPPNAEVIASQGISGRFADRQWIEPLVGPGPLPVNGTRIWFVLAPAEGIGTEPVGAAFATMSMLAGPMRARLVGSVSGIWVFTWDRPTAVHSITMPDTSSELPAWVSPGQAGIAITRGPPSRWRLVDSGKPGYVLAYDYWREPLGAYTATVTLSASGPINVEVWNATSETLLARRQLPLTQGITNLSMPIDNATFYSTSPFSGVGPFEMSPPTSPHEDQLELRVWSPGSITVSVYSIGLLPSYLASNQPGK